VGEFGVWCDIHKAFDGRHACYRRTIESNEAGEAVRNRVNKLEARITNAREHLDFALAHINPKYIKVIRQYVRAALEALDGR
jgi:hypothetical protein